MRTVDVAMGELGITEATGRNDGVPAARYNGEGLPWCAAFLLWCNEQSTDAKLIQANYQRWTLRSVYALQEAMKHRGWWFEACLAVAPNDLVFFGSRGDSDPGPGRHVGIVELVLPRFLHTIEGNLGNAVRRAQHAMDNPRIAGFARIPRADVG